MPAINTDIFKSLVPITQFNKGQASRIFERLRMEKLLIVLKNNIPSAVIISPDEFTRLLEIEEDFKLMKLAAERINNLLNDKCLSYDEVLKENGLTQTDIDNNEAAKRINKNI